MCSRSLTVASDLDLEFGGQFLAFRLRSEEGGDDYQHLEAHGAVHHWQREAYFLIDLGSWVSGPSS
jgi:hypothetical protein